MIKSEIFYKKYGARRLSSLVTGPIFPFTEFQETKNSIYLDTRTNALKVDAFSFIHTSVKVPYYIKPYPDYKEVRVRSTVYQKYVKEVVSTRKYLVTTSFNRSVPENVPVIISTSSFL